MATPLSTLIVAGISLSPLISLIAGILILVMPRLLNFIVDVIESEQRHFAHLFVTWRSAYTSGLAINGRLPKPYECESGC
jgi:hypothetical protein